ncbi:MAG: glycosyltransferase family 4 protein [Armatimonadetes bacterium]|nr:glycosyltransferase family 4 protein [Armatimonadota bacterium]
MLIWLIKDGEYLPIQTGARRMRIGMLASHLAAAGHEVIWWSSTFAHFGKQLLYDRDQVLDIEPGLRLFLLDSGSYGRNISLARLIHHNRFAFRLARELPRQPPPDVIVCCYPIVEMAFQTVRFANRHGIPVVVDIRDAWPDYFLEVVPGWLRGPARLALWPLYWQGRRALKGADALVAISPGFLRWGLSMAGRDSRPLDGVSYHGYEPVRPAEPLSERLAPVVERLEQRVVFVFCGHFTPPYDLHQIVTVAERLADRNDIHFLLVGDGGSAAELEDRSRRLNNLSLTGWVGQSDLAHLLAHCDVGLLPWVSGTRNAMPNKVFEYLAAGCPIISSSVGDLEEMLSEHKVGFSYRARNVGELQELVLHLADDSQRRLRLSANARAAFQQHFRAEVVCARYAERLRRLAR